MRVEWYLRDSSDPEAVSGSSTNFALKAGIPAFFVRFNWRKYGLNQRKSPETARNRTFIRVWSFLAMNFCFYLLNNFFIQKLPLL